MSPIGSISLCRSLLRGGLVDRFRLVMFRVITGAPGAECIYDCYADVALETIDNGTVVGALDSADPSSKASMLLPRWNSEATCR